MKGRVERITITRPSCGYGFIRGIDGKEYFFMPTSVHRAPGLKPWDDIDVGDRVRDFEPDPTPQVKRDGRVLGPRVLDGSVEVPDNE